MSAYVRIFYWLAQWSFLNFMKTEHIQMKQSYKLSIQLYIFDENYRYTFQHTFYLGYGFEGRIKENKWDGLHFLCCWGKNKKKKSHDINSFYCICNGKNCENNPSISISLSLETYHKFFEAWKRSVNVLFSDKLHKQISLSNISGIEL